MGTYTTNMKAYRTLLSKDMHKAAWTEVPLWNQFMGFIGSKGRYPSSIAYGTSIENRPKPTGQPIEVLTNFDYEGGETMDIPVINPLTEEGVYGDKQLLGTEESNKITYKTARINQVRKGILVSTGKMSEQRLKKPNVQKELMTNAKEQLQDWFVKWTGYQPYEAFYRRYSANLTASVAKGGPAVTAASHPNFYAAGYGKATWSDTPATYETNVATAINSLTNTASDLFGTKVIELASAYASRLKIQRFKYSSGGINGQFYAMVINPDQAVQLWSDEKFIASATYSLPREKALNPLFTGELAGIYRGVMIYIDLNNYGVLISGDTGYDATRGTVNYGNANPIKNPQSESDKKLALLFGASGLACGYAQQLSFESETWDYKAKKSEGGSMIVGFERTDVYDTDGYYSTAGLFKENTSSLVVATYSPFSLSWT
ncbi:MAG: DUF4043 family protein [Candidatus Pacearchaeota archaeon]